MGKRKRYTNAEKLALARKASLPGCSIASVARGEGLPQSTVRGFIKNIKKLEENSTVENNLKATHKDKTPTITKALILFCERARSVKPPVPITVETVSTKAKDIATKLLVAYERNTTIMEAEEAEALKLHLFSYTWSFKWLKRNNYISKRLHGEAADVDLIAVADGIAKVREEISNYHPENVYNMDETGLNFRLLPRQTYVHKTEKNVRGTKSMKSKDRVTLYIATNATGSQKVPLSMIGNSKNPRCFGRQQEKRKLIYFDQSKAWSDTRTFTRWFHEVFLPHIRSNTKDKVLLVMGNCGPHGAKISDPLGQVKMMPLPPNCTAVHQPMDQGIIQAVKRKYRYKLLSKVFETMEHRDEL
jgi:transposase-like protein